MIFTYTTAFPNTPPRPYLDVILRNGFYTTNKLVALVDSGADYSIFPNEVAEELRLDLGHASSWSFSGTTGKLQDAKLAEISLAVLKRRMTWNTLLSSELYAHSVTRSDSLVASFLARTVFSRTSRLPSIKLLIALKSNNDDGLNLKSWRFVKAIATVVKASLRFGFGLR